MKWEKRPVRRLARPSRPGTITEMRYERYTILYDSILARGVYERDTPVCVIMLHTVQP